MEIRTFQLTVKFANEAKKFNIGILSLIEFSSDRIHIFSAKELLTNIWYYVIVILIIASNFYSFLIIRKYCSFYFKRYQVNLKTGYRILSVPPKRL